MSKALFQHPHAELLRANGFTDVAVYFEQGCDPEIPDGLTPHEQARLNQSLVSHIRDAFIFLCNEDRFPQGSTLRDPIRRMLQRVDNKCEAKYIVKCMENR